jgi:hypothetical protein
MTGASITPLQPGLVGRRDDATALSPFCRTDQVATLLGVTREGTWV